MKKSRHLNEADQNTQKNSDKPGDPSDSEREFYKSNRKNDLLGDLESEEANQNKKDKEPKFTRKNSDTSAEQSSPAQLDSKQSHEGGVEERLSEIVNPESVSGKQKHEESIEQENVELKGSKQSSNESLPLTIFTDDVEWGDRGHGKPVLMQHGHYMDSLIWFKEKKVGKPLPLQLFDAGYDVWLGNNRGSYNCELQSSRHNERN